MSFYNYHPNSTAKLGLPIDARRPFDDKTTNGFFEWKSYSLDDKNVGAELEFQIKEVTSREELYKKLSLDIKIEAKFGLTNASSSLSWEKEVHFNEKSIIYIFSAKKIYIPETVQGVLEFSEKGKQAWKTAIKNKKIIEFQRVVGNEVVTSIRRGNNITLIYSFNCTSAEQKEKIRAKLDVGWATGNVNVDFKSVLNQIDEYLSLNVYGYQSGVGTTKIENRLSDIITVSPGDMIPIKEIIKDILGNVSNENRDSSPIIEFSTRQVSDISEIFNSDFYDEFVSAIELESSIDESCIKLSNISLENTINNEELTELNKVWNKADFKEGSKEIIEKKLAELDDQRSLILKEFKKCINARKETDCSINIKYVSILKYSDVIILPLIIPLSWNNYTTVSQEGFDIDYGVFTTYFYPSVHIKFPKAINSFYIIKNNIRVSFFNQETISQLQKNNGSFKDIWTTIQQDYHVYVWAWHAPFVEETRINKNKEHISRELQNEYKLQIILDDGTMHEVNIGNGAKPISLPIAYFSNINPDILKGFREGYLIKGE